MSADRRSHITELFHEAVMLPPDEQSVFLNQACSGDNELIQSIKNLLDAYAEIRTVDPPRPGQIESQLDANTVAALAERYKEITLIGRGGMGVVLRAYDREIGKVVALKILPPSLAHDDRATERFRNEIRLALEITHKNICRTYSLEKFNGRLVISMEYVEGDTLRTILDRVRGVSVPQGVSWAKQICDALTAAHEKKVVHRDLKPENIMIDHGGHVKVMDFGIARSIDGPERTEGTIIGTPRYMSPEQALGRAVGPTSDIYSLGLVLYELFTGVPHNQELRVPPSEANPDLPVRIDSAIRKSLLGEPRQRFQSAQEFAVALTEHAVKATPQHFRMRYAFYAAASALAILTIGLVVNHLKPAAGPLTELRSAAPKSAPILPAQTTSEHLTSTESVDSANNPNTTSPKAVLPQSRPVEATSVVQGTWFIRISGLRSSYFNVTFLQNPGGDVVGTFLSPLAGQIKGKMAGNLLTFQVTVSALSCSGAFQGAARISANKGSGTFTGSDCSGDYGKGTILMGKWSPAALAEHEEMRRLTIGQYLSTKLLTWTEDDARANMGEELLHRNGYDDGHTLTSDIYTFADPTMLTDRIELAFDIKTKRLANIFVYPLGKQTEDGVKKLWGENFAVKENPDGSRFLNYNDRAVNVFLDKDGKVISIGIYRRL